MRRLIAFTVTVLVAVIGARYTDWSEPSSATFAPETHRPDAVPGERSRVPAEPVDSAGRLARDAADRLARAFEERRNDLQVSGAGVVQRVLSDDVDGDRHQRFVLGLSSGQTVLVAHNIDLAPRIAGIDVGDVVEFFGEYEWNPQGGVIHWTHHDPAGRHEDGWLRHDGRLYQ